MATSRDVRVAIVGAGFGGLGMAIALARAGIDDFVVLERADDLGGTWRDNAYPGCRCDVESLLYSFSFWPDTRSPELMAAQPHILGYMRAAAERFGIMPRIRFRHPVTAARWSDAEALWKVETPHGELRAQVLVVAAGPFSEPSTPAIPGLERFRGRAVHTGRWRDEGADLAGQRVAVVGTGSTGVQLVPEIQPHVERLHLFQRTPAWVLKSRNRPLRPIERRLIATLPPVRRAARLGMLLKRELLVFPFRDPRLMKAIEPRLLRKLAREVPDPETRAMLTPDYVMGCKRVTFATGYWRALAQPNAEVVTDPIAEIGERSIVTADGTEREVDTIVFATGFRLAQPSMASWLRGRDGVLLRDAWDGHVRAYRGTTIPRFPNMFAVSGQNAGTAHASMVYLQEAQAAYVVDALRAMDRDGVDVVEVRPEALAAWDAEMERLFRGTVWDAGCRNHYMDAGGRNVVVWPTFSFRYRRLMRRFDREAYVLSRHRAPLSEPVAA